jgi:hypothetical protein
MVRASIKKNADGKLNAVNVHDGKVKKKTSPSQQIH